MTEDFRDLGAVARRVAEAVGASDVVIVHLECGPAVFVTPPDVDHADRESLKQHLWGQIFDSAYAKGLPSSDPAFNSTTFDSSYTKAPLSDEDLRPVMNDLSKLVTSFAPRRVLEIGCGMGILLFLIAPTCERYVGLDLSASALSHVERHLGVLRNRVELVQASAADLDRFPADSFDLVLVNSTAQYFPGVDYLLKVLRGAERLLAEGGQILLGDLRCLSLGELFYASVAVHQADGAATAESLRANVRKAAAHERELLLEPCILHALSRYLPRLARTFHAIHASSRMNELTQFRYNALLSFDGSAERPAIDWLDWPESGNPLDRIRASVARSDAVCIGIRGVPNPRLKEAVLARRWLASAGGGELVDDARRDWRASRQVRIDLESLAVLGDTMGRRIAQAFSPGDGEGRLDVLLTRSSSPYASFVPSSACNHVTAAAGRLPMDYANDPLRARRREKLETAVRAHLPESLRVAPVFPVAVIPRTSEDVVDVAQLKDVAALFAAKESSAKP
jgi:SAM-dependent methyltransferase